MNVIAELLLAFLILPVWNFELLYLCFRLERNKLEHRVEGEEELVDGGFAWVPFAQTADHDAPAVLGPVRHDYVKFLLVDSDGRRFALREEDRYCKQLSTSVGFI